MRKYLTILALSACASPLSAFHLVSDTTAQAMQVEEIAEAVNMVKTGAEQIRAVMQVYKEVKAVYDTVGEVRDMYNNISSYWDAFTNGWMFDSVDDLDDFMCTADDKWIFFCAPKAIGCAGGFSTPPLPAFWAMPSLALKNSARTQAIRSLHSAGCLMTIRGTMC